LRKNIGWPADDRQAEHNCHSRNSSFFETRPPYKKGIKLLQNLSKSKVDYLLEELPGPENIYRYIYGENQGKIRCNRNCGKGK
jgi:hypothetical protein